MSGDGAPPKGPAQDAVTNRQADETCVAVDDSLDRQLRFAIAHRRLVELTYHGQLRIVEPHDYGVQNGTVKLFTYQRRQAGRAQDKRGFGWKLFLASKIESCTITEVSFDGSRADSHQHHVVWDRVFARVTGAAPHLDSPTRLAKSRRVLRLVHGARTK